MKCLGKAVWLGVDLRVVKSRLLKVCRCCGGGKVKSLLAMRCLLFTRAQILVGHVTVDGVARSRLALDRGNGFQICIVGMESGR